MRALGVVLVGFVTALLLIQIGRKDAPHYEARHEPQRLVDWGTLAAGERGDFVVMRDGKLIGMMANKPDRILEMVYFVDLGNYGHVDLGPTQCPKDWVLIKPNSNGSLRSYADYANEFVQRSADNFKEYRSYEIW